MALLPDGRLLVTEKPGRLRIFANGKLSEPLENVPAVAYRPKPSEQGGLLDVAVDPEFAQNQRIYLSYSEEAPQKSAQADTDDPRFGRVPRPHGQPADGWSRHARDGSTATGSRTHR